MERQLGEFSSINFDSANHWIGTSEIVAMKPISMEYENAPNEDFDYHPCCFRILKPLLCPVVTVTDPLEFEGMDRGLVYENPGSNAQTGDNVMGIETLTPGRRGQPTNIATTSISSVTAPRNEDSRGWIVNSTFEKGESIDPPRKGKSILNIDSHSNEEIYRSMRDESPEAVIQSCTTLATSTTSSYWMDEHRQQTDAGSQTRYPHLSIAPEEQVIEQEPISPQPCSSGDSIEEDLASSDHHTNSPMTNESIDAVSEKDFHDLAIRFQKLCLQEPSEKQLIVESQETGCVGSRSSCVCPLSDQDEITTSSTFISVTSNEWPELVADKFQSSPEAVSIDVCIILDDSSVIIRERLMPLLLQSIEKLWDYLSVAQEASLRMSILKPGMKLDFTTDKKKVLSFARTGSTKYQKTDNDVASGLANATSGLPTLSWHLTSSSTRAVYFLSNLSGWDVDEKTMGLTLSSLYNSLGSLPPKKKTKVLVGTWLNHNEPLLRALTLRRRRHQCFRLLDTRAMASFVMTDKELLNTLCTPQLVSKKGKTRVRISEKGNTWHLVFEKENPWFSAGSRVSLNLLQASPYMLMPFSKSQACLMKCREPKSLQDIIANTLPSFRSSSCWIMRSATELKPPTDSMYLVGKIGHTRLDKWDETVLLQCLLQNVLSKNTSLRNEDQELFSNKKSLQNEAHCKWLAQVSSTASFLATEFNRHYKPKHCAKLRFLPGFVVKETSPKGHIFYAEQLNYPRTDVPKMVQYLTAGGEWNKDAADESLLRFTQMCFKISGGDLMLTGLRGFYRSGTFYLATPVLLTRTQRDASVNSCHKEYIRLCRQNARTLMEERSWNKTSGK